MTILASEADSSPSSPSLARWIEAISTPNSVPVCADESTLSFSAKGELKVTPPPPKPTLLERIKRIIPRILAAIAHLFALLRHLIDRSFIPKRWVVAEQRAEANRKMWKSFEEALGAHPIEGKNAFLDRFKTRYAAWLPADPGKGPVQAKHLKWAAALSWWPHLSDFPAKPGGYTRQELVEKIAPLRLSASWLEALDPPHILQGTPLTLADNLKHNLPAMDQQASRLVQDFLHLEKELRYGEWAGMTRLAKALVNMQFEPGTLIPILNKDGLLDFFAVEKRFNFPAGLSGYLLKPIASDSSLSWTLIFGPTKFAPGAHNALATWYNDFEPDLGESGWQAAKETMERYFQEIPQLLTGTPDYIGYSLGGAQMIKCFQTMMRREGVVEKIKRGEFCPRFLSFNPPGEEPKAEHQFSAWAQKHIPQAVPRKIPIRFFHSYRPSADKIGLEPDPVQTLQGPKSRGLLGHGAFDVQVIKVIFDHWSPSLTLHSLRGLDAPKPCKAELLTSEQLSTETHRAELDNTMLAPPHRIWEQFRIQWGQIIWPLVHFLSKLLTKLNLLHPVEETIT